MRIGISAEWVGADAGGPETYTAHLIRALGRLATGHEFRVYACSHAPGTWCREIGRSMEVVEVGRSRKTALPFGIPLDLYRRPVDLLHATYVVPPVCPTRCVLTLHDIGFVLRPELFPWIIRQRLTLLTRWGAKRARRIITISQYSKGTIVDVLGVEPERVVVTPLGVDDVYHPADEDDEAVLRRHGLSSGYILYVGKVQARKNTARLVRAYHALRQRLKDPPPLVIAGPRTWKSDETFETVERLSLAGDITFTGYVPDGDLPALYRRALLLVYPSLFEGFALPLIEAMACGTPVVASRITSIPEVAGDAAVLFDPTSVEDIADSLHRVVTDAGMRSRLVARGLARARTFSWRETARKTLEAYEEAR